MIPKYNDFIAKGGTHNVRYLDKDYLIKMPIKNDEQSIFAFDAHIKFMQKYPDLFVNIKKLDKNKASVEKVDTNKAQKEIGHIAKIAEKLLPAKIPFYIQAAFEPESLIIHNLYNRTDDKKSDLIAKNLFTDLKKYGEKNSDDIINRWITFIEKLIINFEYRWFDLHWGNFGIDKNGNIKLIDF